MRRASLPCSLASRIWHSCDYGLCDFDITKSSTSAARMNCPQVRKNASLRTAARSSTRSSGVENKLDSTLQGGQPFTIHCVECYDFRVWLQRTLGSGQDRYAARTTSISG